MKRKKKRAGRRIALRAREKAAVKIINNHLPTPGKGRKAWTGSPTCALLDLLVLFGQRLPYKLRG